MDHLMLYICIGGKYICNLGMPQHKIHITCYDRSYDMLMLHQLCLLLEVLCTKNIFLHNGMHTAQTAFAINSCIMYLGIEHIRHKLVDESIKYIIGRIFNHNTLIKHS